MEVQTTAYELLAYTIEAVSNEKVVPKRHRWSLGARMLDAAVALAGHVDIANTMLLTDQCQALERHLEQRKALAETFRLTTLIFCARRISHFQESRHVYWTELVRKEQELLRGWMDSDRRRISNPT